MKKSHVYNVAKVILGTGIGFSLFWLTSHPKSRIHKKLPVKKIKQVHLIPHIKVVGKEKTYHFHHWVLLIIFYLPFMFKRKFRRSKIINGIIAGGILQGLHYKDRFRFRYPTKEE